MKNYPSIMFWSIINFLLGGKAQGVDNHTFHNFYLEHVIEIVDLEEDLGDLEVLDAQALHYFYDVAREHFVQTPEFIRHEALLKKYLEIGETILEYSSEMEDDELQDLLDACAYLEDEIIASKEILCNMEKHYALQVILDFQSYVYGKENE